MGNTLFSVLNRALTCKTGIPDQSSHQILAIMYGIYYDLRLDYAGLIFDEMVSAVQAKIRVRLVCRLDRTGQDRTGQDRTGQNNCPAFSKI